MSKVGAPESQTQKDVIKLFQERLGYSFLGNWKYRSDNRNIEPDYVREFLKKQGYDEVLISRALHELTKTATNLSEGLYYANRAVYELLRYGVKVKPDVGEQTQTVWLIDWKHPAKNNFAIAEEVTVEAQGVGAHEKRPDIVLYVNGIALGVLELKRSTVDVSEGIRQNLDNQKELFIQPFFSTMQYVMAGNITQGLRYGTIDTKEKYYLTWKEPSKEANPLHQHLLQLCAKERFLELIHDFIVFDAGRKKLCRPNQYFGVKAAQRAIKKREGGIIWHTQGSGKSLTMVWLTKWIKENRPYSRVLIITDRTELDEQIEKVFLGVNEAIYRTTSGADLITTLNAPAPWLVCSLIHKFGGKEDGESVGDIPGYIAELKRAIPAGFKPKGDLYVFVDECHRTQSGALHGAMKELLPGAMFIGFTGTPLLKADKKRSIEVFGPYIHTYKFDEAIQDRVVLDLRYEARQIDQRITSQKKVDEWFEAKTKGLTPLAKAQLKKRWGTMQAVLSSRSRLEIIVADILLDMAQRPRLMDGHGNAILVSSSIYEACKFHELFAKTELAGHCAIVTSYTPSAAAIKGEESGEGDTEKIEQYKIYRQMLADWFKEDEATAINKLELFEQQVKQRFITDPAQMKLLIVVDKLLTGFDAPSATYLYIDKQMRDHGLFQAICRVNRLHGNDKEYGYIIDYMDLFQSLEGAVQDYTSGALDGFAKEDVEGLISDRIEKGRERLEEALEQIRALCEPVEAPKDEPAHVRYFVAMVSGNAAQMQANEPKRLSLYTYTAALVRAFANLGNELVEAGYTPAQEKALRAEVDHFVTICEAVKIASGDKINLKQYEPAMRHLIDTYIRAEESESISAFDDLSLIQLIVERGEGAIDALPKGLRRNPQAVAETIENNVRRLIIDEQPINPKYYEKMSELLDALIEQRKQGAMEYGAYLQKIAELTRQIKNPTATTAYPQTLNTGLKRALFDNLGQDEALALRVDEALRESCQDDWTSHPQKVKKVRRAIKDALEQDEERTEQILNLVRKHCEQQ